MSVADVKTFVIVGDRHAEPTPDALTEIGLLLAEQQPVRVRVRSSTKLVITSEFEKAVTDLIHRMLNSGFSVSFDCVVPQASGRRYNWLRDYALVDGADKVIAYFSRRGFMQGGTGHVVQAALNCNVPVEAWMHDEGGNMIALQDDGQDAWQ